MTRFSSPSDIETSVAAGDLCEAGLLMSGESATSERDEVPGLSLAFLGGEGLSTGPGVPLPAPGLTLMPGSSGGEN